jgi:methylated-DNA-[protein]-cysteine S-methyltransferase
MPQTTGSLDQFYMFSLKTDIGWMRPISDGTNLIRLDWNQTGWHEPNRPDHVSRETTSQLQAFLTGRLYEFTLPLAPAGKSPVGQYWLNVMTKIPYGTVMTYAEFARLAGKPNAARAAGRSCASNPIPIIYPCHRVIRTDGTLGNYGGGSNKNTSHADNLSRKAALLELEAYRVKLIA